MHVNHKRWPRDIYHAWAGMAPANHLVMQS
jgi:hypothetical protein